MEGSLLCTPSGMVSGGPVRPVSRLSFFRLANWARSVIKAGRFIVRGGKNNHSFDFLPMGILWRTIYLEKAGTQKQNGKKIFWRGIISFNANNYVKQNSS